jgi:hypothetical protein
MQQQQYQQMGKVEMVKEGLKNEGNQRRKYSKSPYNIPLLTTNQPKGLFIHRFKNECWFESTSMRGGFSHSSTYGCQKSSPLPRDATV